MVGRKGTPQTVLAAAYRMALEQTLVIIFDQAPENASRSVEAWWRRLVENDAAKSGIYLHSEPLKIAAKMAGRVGGIPATTTPAYQKILRESLDTAQSQYRRKVTKKTDTPSQPVGPRSLRMSA